MAPLRAFTLVCILALAPWAALAAEAPATAVVPGREAPAAAAAAAAYRFSWDKYVSLVVIGDTGGVANSLRSPAWVVTYDTKGSVVVGYRATAFRDKLGNLHIDARKAIISGPQNDSWSPDSFAIGLDGQVLTIDDNPEHPPNVGRVTETTAASDDSAYRTLLGIAMAIVREMS